MDNSNDMDLTGKWKYTEDYVHGTAKGELYLRQKGDKLSGRLVFTDHVKEEEPYMIQEFLKGRIEEHKVYLEAWEYDIIHATIPISYELDSWLGILVEDTIIKGSSIDEQGVAGNFEFIKLENHLPSICDFRV
jgi:hypothetical protein